jgi:hypothetical protein
MSDSLEPSINISVFTDLCVGWSHEIDRACHQAAAYRVLERSRGGGGTGYSLSRDEVLGLFREGKLVIDPEKTKLKAYRNKLDRLMQEHNLTREDLKLPPESPTA